MDSDYLYYTFPTYGYLTKQFTVSDLSPVLLEIDSIKSNFVKAENVNSKLAGQIERQYKLDKSKKHIEDLILPFAQEYDRIFNYFKSFKCLSTIPDITLDDVWVNFQKKYEYNPPHDHSGVLSFVIWVNIPYTSTDEKLYSPGYNSISPKSGNFEFFYINNVNGISVETISVSKETELTCIIFPSTFVHQVYPFYTSDDYRISVAGNFKFNIS